MGKGSNSVTTAPTKEMQERYTKLLDRATAVSNRPYVPYTGQLVAQQGSLERQANAQVGAAGQAYKPYFAKAQTYADQSTRDITPQKWSAAAMQQYMNPYQGQVVNATMANIRNTNAEQMAGLEGNAISKGAWGGDRGGIAAAEMARQQGLASNQTLAELNAGNYNQANQMWSQQQGVDVAAQQASRQHEAEAAGMYGNMGVSAGKSEMDRIAAMSQLGMQERAVRQAQDQAKYSQYQAKQQYPFQTMGWLGNLLTGVGSQTGGSTTYPEPSFLSQISGLALGGLGTAAGLGWKPFGAKHGGRVGYEEGGRVGYARGGGPYSSIPYEGDPFAGIALPGVRPEDDVGGAYGPYGAPIITGGAPSSGAGGSGGGPVAPVAPAVPTTGGITAGFGAAGVPTGLPMPSVAASSISPALTPSVVPTNVPMPSVASPEGISPGVDPATTGATPAVPGAPAKDPNAGLFGLGRDKWMAIAAGGFGMAASPSHYFGQAAGQGGQAMLGYLNQQKAYDLEQRKLDDEKSYRGDSIGMQKQQLELDRQKQATDEALRISSQHLTGVQVIGEPGGNYKFFYPGETDPKKRIVDSGIKVPSAVPAGWTVADEGAPADAAGTPATEPTAVEPPTASVAPESAAAAPAAVPAVAPRDVGGPEIPAVTPSAGGPPPKVAAPAAAATAATPAATAPVISAAGPKLVPGTSEVIPSAIPTRDEAAAAAKAAAAIPAKPAVVPSDAAPITPKVAAAAGAPGATHRRVVRVRMADGRLIEKPQYTHILTREEKVAEGLDPRGDYERDDQTGETKGIGQPRQFEPAGIKALSEHVAKYMAGGETAQDRLRLVRVMRVALNKGGKDVFVGPFSDIVRQVKSALVNLGLGKEIEGMGETDIMDKGSILLATEGTKALTSRPSQFEFEKNILANPGLAMSKEGNRLIMNMIEQQAADDVALGDLAAQTLADGNEEQWPKIYRDYYDKHPLKSPWDPEKLLSEEEIADHVYPTLSVEEAAKVPKDTWFKGVDGVLYKKN